MHKFLKVLTIKQVIRSIDRKSNYRFPIIDPPILVDDKKLNSDKEEKLDSKDVKVAQAS